MGYGTCVQHSLASVCLKGSFVLGADVDRLEVCKPLVWCSRHEKLKGGCSEATNKPPPPQIKRQTNKQNQNRITPWSKNIIWNIIESKVSKNCYVYPHHRNNLHHRWTSGQAQYCVRILGVWISLTYHAHMPQDIIRSYMKGTQAMGTILSYGAHKPWSRVWSCPVYTDNGAWFLLAYSIYIWWGVD